LRHARAAAASALARPALAGDTRVLRFVPASNPLGFYKPKSAYRNRITGLIRSDLSRFWNVRPS